ncbi:hypothetical protein GAMM_290004 [Gammaproteobacteria bacterium]
MNKEQEERLKSIRGEIKAAKNRIDEYDKQLLEIKIGLKKESEILRKLYEEQLAIGYSIKPQ